MKKIWKSKTLNFNALALAVFSLLRVFGYEIPEEVVVAGVTVVNFVLRFFTKEPVGLK